MELATRRDRLFAWIIDQIPFYLIVFGAAISFFGTRFSNHFSGSGYLFWPCFGLGLMYICIQFWLLTTLGQTIGKKAMGLRIVRTIDLSNGGFVTNVLLRIVASRAISLVPIVGTLYFIIDPAFIFRDDRRCVHDHIAGTCVIKA